MTPTPVLLTSVSFEETIVVALECVRRDPAAVLASSFYLLRTEPRNARAHFVLGAAELELGHYGRGLAELQRAIRLDSRYARACSLIVPAGRSEETEGAATQNDNVRRFIPTEKTVRCGAKP